MQRIFLILFTKCLFFRETIGNYIKRALYLFFESGGGQFGTSLIIIRKFIFHLQNNEIYLKNYFLFCKSKIKRGVLRPCHPTLLLHVRKNQKQSSCLLWDSSPKPCRPSLNQLLSENLWQVLAAGNSIERRLHYILHECLAKTIVIGCHRLKHCSKILYNNSINTAPGAVYRLNDFGTSVRPSCLPQTDTHTAQQHGTSKEIRDTSCSF